MSHAVGTACVLADLGLDEVTVAAGLLHGVLDKTGIGADQIIELIPGEDLPEMVQRVARLSEISELNHLECFADDDLALQRLRAMLLSMADVRVVLVKLAERLHTMRTISLLAPEEQRCLAKEALQVFAPLANRLGVWGLKAELEDLAFRTLHPDEHAALEAKVRDGIHAMKITASLDKLKCALDAAGIHTEDLSGRSKNLYSLYRKMQKKGYGMDQIYDVRAVRIIVGSKADCYEALRQVHQLWEPVAGRFKDYIRLKKRNGYQSLHTVVTGDDGLPIEVQIRTAKMHYIAEHGVAAHWRYKEGETACGPDAATEAHVEFARWLISWELELQDKKCRPSGSPEHDRTLAALHGELCRFPEHNKACPFHSLQTGGPQAPDEGTSPVYCVVVHHGPEGGDGSRPCSAISPLRTELLELPPGTTTGQLLRDGALGPPSLLEGKRLLVNHCAEAAPGETPIRMGDQVEVVYEPLPTAEELNPWDLLVEQPEELGRESLAVGAGGGCSSGPVEDLETRRRVFDDLYYSGLARRGWTMTAV